MALFKLTEEEIEIMDRLIDKFESIKNKNDINNKSFMHNNW